MEKKLEAKLRNKIKEAGGLALKFSSTSFTGIPDRLVLMPGGHIFFCELKNGNKGILSARQVVVHKVLAGLGFKVYVVSNEIELQNFLKCLI